MGIFNKKNEKEAKPDGDEKKKAVKKTSTKKTVEKKDTATTEKKSTTSDKNKSVVKEAYKVLIKPLITEKASSGAADSKYVFEVSVNANKIQIAKAIDEVYGIKPIAVNVVNMAGKVVRRGRMEGRRKDWRKAIVTLPKGKTIDIYEGI